MPTGLIVTYILMALFAQLGVELVIRGVGFDG
jgi:hypothetical protein